MTEANPNPARVNIQLLHGDDTFSITREIRRIVSQLSSPMEADMNTVRIDGKTASLEEIQNAVSTLPFFGGDRLVILESMPAKLDKSRQEKFIKILSSVPETTRVVLVIEDHPRWRKDGAQWLRSWDVINETHWLARWMKDQPNTAVLPFALPESRDMDGWIQKEALEQGGKFSAEAAHELSQYIGNDTAIASQEIAKLLMYVNGARPVSREDVISLVSDAGSSDVFTMLDAMADGNAREAQKILHRLLDDTPAEVVMGAVVHRFRQLIQVREALDEGDDLKTLISQRVIFAGKQAVKISSQAGRFDLNTLKAIYHHLLDLDVQSKTSQLDLETNLEVLVVELAGR